MTIKEELLKHTALSGLTTLWLYRVLENDDDGDPLDHGVLRANNLGIMEQLLKARLETLEATPGKHLVRVYPVKDADEGILENIDDFLDIDVVVGQLDAVPTVASRHGEPDREEIAPTRSPANDEQTFLPIIEKGHVVMNLKIIAIDFHRNGVCGAPFNVVLFEDESEGHKVAIVFERTGHCAVLSVKKLAAGDTAFGSNSWRGDHVESDLRQEIANRQHDDAWRERRESKPIPKVHRA